MSYVLVEREKLGPTAYRIDRARTLPPAADLDSRYEAFAAIVRQSDRFAPDGTHTLVLLSDES